MSEIIEMTVKQERRIKNDLWKTICNPKTKNDRQSRKRFIEVLQKLKYQQGGLTGTRRVDDSRIREYLRSGKIPQTDLIPCDIALYVTVFDVKTDPI